ncbi:MAG: AraC family transcriptional activator of pobA [Flavobacteriaceae bacterium]|jgi:AraC family transcriptional activator of pobA
MKFTGDTGEYFEIQHIDKDNCSPLKEQLEGTLRLLWFTSDNNTIIIDGAPYSFNKNSIVFLTQFHALEYEFVDTVKLLRFNQPFYCILDHDSEVGCKGILYYGGSDVPVVIPNKQEADVLETAWKMALLEFEMHDNLQLEMLQMMLKRILILCTRIYKRETEFDQLQPAQNEIIREFNYLVETHFKEKHAVADYADLLFKSPKTISNVFNKLGAKSPLQFIQERIHLEARRLLWYSNRDVSEIAYELGFKDIQVFSRFFKNKEGVSASVYRDKKDATRVK